MCVREEESLLKEIAHRESGSDLLRKVEEQKILTAEKLKDMLLLNVDPFHLQLEASFIHSAIVR